MDLVALQNQATLGCISPSGLAIHRAFNRWLPHHRQRVCQPSGLEEGPKA